MWYLRCSAVNLLGKGKPTKAELDTRLRVERDPFISRTLIIRNSPPSVKPEGQRIPLIELIAITSVIPVKATSATLIGLIAIRPWEVSVIPKEQNITPLNSVRWHLLEMKRKQGYFQTKGIWSCIFLENFNSQMLKYKKPGSTIFLEILWKLWAYVFLTWLDNKILDLIGFHVIFVCVCVCVCVCLDLRWLPALKQIKS